MLPIVVEYVPVLQFLHVVDDGFNENVPARHMLQVEGDVAAKMLE